MFESAELRHEMSDATYDRETRKLRPRLLEAQYDLLAGKTFPVIVLVNGLPGAGKGETVNLLNEWLDPRHVQSRAFGPPSDEERSRPPMWRFWRELPAKGKIGVLFGNWYTDPIVARARGSLKNSELEAEVVRIQRFEQMLAADGALLVKLWFHLSKKAMKRRFAELEASKLTRWRVTKADWEAYAHYDDFAPVNELVLRETSTAEAPWVVIDGSNANYRAITAAKTLLAALQNKLRETKAETPNRRPTTSASEALSTVDTARILRELPFKERLSKEKFITKVAKVQGVLATQARSSKLQKRAVIIVFEGMDAAGKGGAIRRVTQSLDARYYDVIPVAAPTDVERGYPYLWRFWRHIPRHGRFTIFDRSWYGRVLVERVEGYAPQSVWTRAYSEINDFEQQLVDAGTILVKIWLAVTKDEQLRRFKEREATKFKQFKITPDDWRNRKKWDDYTHAAGDMIERTSTSIAPWHIIEADDKHLARVRTIETISQRIEMAFRKKK